MGSLKLKWVKASPNSPTSAAALVHDFDGHQIHIICLVDKSVYAPNHGEVWMWGPEYFQILSEGYILYSSPPLTTERLWGKYQYRG
jgi:hypothetical protein